MSVTRAQRISGALGSRSLKLRDRRLAGAGPAGLWGDLGGTDIAVAIDGGRMNIRTARPGRVAADRSRHGHRTDWREPRLHIIHEAGKGGRLPRGGRQPAGGTPGSPDGLAALPAADLRRVGAASARRVTFPGDGAVRIRGRVDAIAEAAGIPAGKCARCLDFHHAVRHPAVFAEHAGFRDTCERVRWLDSLMRLMMTGTADAVIGAISERIGGRRLGRESRGVCETELRYFERNRDGLTRALSGAQGLPIGSGSIGSLVRRVASLRLKGSGMFWKRENAEAFIHMRCMLKSGNWNTLCEEIWGSREARA